MALDFPKIPIASARFGLKRIQATFESQFSKKSATLFHAGGLTDRWEGIYVTPALGVEDAQALKSFLTQLKGQVGTFHAFNPDRTKPATYLEADLYADDDLRTADLNTITVDNTDFPGKGKVDGNMQSGHNLATREWPKSSLILNAGDFFQVANQLFISTSDVTSDAFGRATIFLEPAIRQNLMDGADILTSSPVMVARLSVPFVAVEMGARHANPVSLPFEEVI